MKKGEYTSEYFQKNKERALESQRKYRAKNRKEINRKAKERQRKYYAKEENRLKRYKYNKEWWKKKIEEREEEIGRKKPEKCEICNGSGDGYGKICFDHCHKTDRARGWICMKCNTILGKVDDNVRLLEKIIEYLKINQ